MRSPIVTNRDHCSSGMIAPTQSSTATTSLTIVNESIQRSEANDISVVSCRGSMLAAAAITVRTWSSTSRDFIEVHLPHYVRPARKFV